MYRLLLVLLGIISQGCKFLGCSGGSELYTVAGHWSVSTGY